MNNALIKIKSNQVEINNLFSHALVARWLKFAGVAEKSVTTYQTAIKQMFKYFHCNNIINPCREDLENWRDSLIDSGKSANTVRLYIASAKLFFRWLAQEEIYKNIADHLKPRVKISGEHKKDFLSKEQSKKLLKSMTSKNSIKDKRNAAIVALMLTAGLRTIEICRADIGDIRTINGATFLFVLGKGRSEKAESVRLAPQVYSLIKAYLQMRGEVKADEPLFVSTSNRCKNQRLDTQTIRKMVKSNLRNIGLDSDRLSAHSLRHTAATQMLLNGVKLEEVQMVLRHRNITVTQIYNHAIQRMQNEGENIVANAIFDKGGGFL